MTEQTIARRPVSLAGFGLAAVYLILKLRAKKVCVMLAAMRQNSSQLGSLAATHLPGSPVPWK
jgi:hypothetical protein